MLQKVIKVGNSLAITIPKAFLTKHNIKAGDNLVVHSQENQPVISMFASKQAAEEYVSGEFVSAVDKFTQKNLPLLKKLADA